MAADPGHKEKRIHRRRSYFGPILLITLGLLFLGKNVGLIPGAGWSTIWRLWPVLLIVAGVDDLFRREGIAWPILLIGAGAILLVNYFYPQSWISWSRIVQLWPVLLIAVGVDVLFRGQTGWMNLVGVLVALILLGGAAWLIGQQGVVSAETSAIKESYSTLAEAADVNLSLDVGDLSVDADASSGVLISGSITPSTAVEDLSESGETVQYGLESQEPTFIPLTGRWALSLSPELPLSLQVNSGVGDMELELSELELAGLWANQGVGRMEIEMPPSSPEAIRVKQGVGYIQIRIPDQARIAIDAQNGLSKVDFPRGFELENGYYVTPGTTADNADLLISVEQGIGLVEFVEY